MLILAILTPKASASMAEFLPLQLQEEKAVWAHYAAGRLRSMYFQPEPLRVLLFWELPDKQAAEASLGTLPMVAAGLFDTDLIAAGPWLPLTALFSADQSVLV